MIDEIALQVHDAHTNHQHEGNDELQTNQDGTQHTTFGRQAKGTLQHQGWWEGGDVVRRIDTSHQTYNDAEQQGESYQQLMVLQQDASLY